jgi:hypothetical protein
MTFVDFSDYGVEDSMPYDPEELAVIDLQAHMLLRGVDNVECRQQLDLWELALEWEAKSHDRPTDKWFNQALLCIALRGYLGDRGPKFFDLSDLG